MNDRELIEHWKSGYYATGEDIYRIQKWCRMVWRACLERESDRQREAREKRCARG